MSLDTKDIADPSAAELVAAHYERQKPIQDIHG